MNSKWHFYISVFKSIIRIGGCLFSVMFNQWTYLAIGFGIAEVLGILEELNDKR